MEGLSVKSLRLPHSCGDESVNFTSLPEFKKIPGEGIFFIFFLEFYRIALRFSSFTSNSELNSQKLKIKTKFSCLI